MKKILSKLGFDSGSRSDEKIGWRGTGASNADMYKCEFCGQEHLDFSLLEHQQDCPVVYLRTAALTGKDA